MASIQPISAGRFLQILCNVPPSNSQIKACVLVTKPMQNLKKVMGRDGYLAQHEQL